ncbi:MAG: bifunctional 5,10-methylenetetrahydrofolate dehydrogenase/5,10-methenyltetrahydrofolate cyclohydrolase [bacterium]|nr:bifunctional 5,10-methylenetetrahydrofolate dehydrogenase/5,10-methenyltetrahydrofolate cyclohydrolase [bacterium]
MAIIIDGKKVRDERRAILGARIASLKDKIENFISPALAIVQIGDRAESNIYIKNKIIFGEKVGISVILKKYPDSILESEIISEIKKVGEDAGVDGIIVQLPLPAHLNKNNVLDAIPLNKDADGLTSANSELFYSDDKNDKSSFEKAVIPATARGVMELCTAYGIFFEGKNVTVLGRSNLVGRPIAKLVERKGGKVTVCHRVTTDIPAKVKSADIVITAIGSPGFIRKDWVKDGQIIIDVGLTVLKDSEGKNKFSGDVSFDEVSPIVKMITPVPGGVGAMTVLALFENILDLFLNSRNM